MHALLLLALIAAPAPLPREPATWSPMKAEFVRATWAGQEWMCWLAPNGVYYSIYQGRSYRGHWIWDARTRTLLICERPYRDNDPPDPKLPGISWTLTLDRSGRGKTSGGILVDLSRRK